MDKRVIFLLSFLSLFFSPAKVSAAPLFPLHIGDVRECQAWDIENGFYPEIVQILRTVIIDSQVFFTNSPEGTPFDESTFVRSTDNAVYTWEEGTYYEFVVDASTPIETVAVPYGGPYTAYVECMDEGADGYTYNYYVPGIGFVKAMEYSASGQLLYTTELVDIHFATEPCECDLNNDGRCDMRDWLLFGQRWGAMNCATVPCACDLNTDGRCDMRDWLQFGQDWGRTDCPTQ